MTQSPDDSIQKARDILKAQVVSLTAELARIDRERSEVARRLNTAQRGLIALESEESFVPAIPIHGIRPNQFSGKNLAVAIVEYLDMQEGRSEVSLDELTQAMKQGGASLGKTEKREWTNVKIAVSTNPKLLSLRGHMVSKARKS